MASEEEVPLLQSEMSIITSKRRWARPNRLLGLIFPPSLFVLAWKGSKLVICETGWGYLVLTSQRPIVGILYIASFVFWLCTLTFLFFSVYLAPYRESPSLVPRDPPPEVIQRTAVYECDAEGRAVICLKDSCDGAWRSVRTRHCVDCGKCRPRDDHHCPFLDSHIYAPNFKSFALFLLSAVFLIGIAIIPLIPLQLRSLNAVTSATWDLPVLHDVWWDRWYSWLGGPIYRYAIAVNYGYSAYHKLDPPPQPLLPPFIRYLEGSSVSRIAYETWPCPTLSTPSLVTLLVVFSGFFVLIVAIAMCITIVFNARRGVGAVQVERIRRWEAQQNSKSAPLWDARIRLWIPLPESQSAQGGAIVMVDPNAALYDFGPSQNWRNLMGPNWRAWIAPWRHESTNDLEINPAVLENLRDEAMKRAS